MTVKLFIRFRVLCLRYLRRATPLGANARIWQHFQNADSQPLDFFQHIFRPENGAERAQTGLRNGHSCTATVAILAFNCGSLQARWARMRKSVGFSGGLRQVFRSGWRVFTEVLLLILFVTARCLPGLPSAFFIGYVSNTQICFPSNISCLLWLPFQSRK